MKRRFYLLLFLAVLILAVIIPSRIFAETNDEPTVEELKKQIELLQKRVNELEAAQSKPQRATARPSPDAYTQDWDPFEEINRMQEEMDVMFRGAFSRPESQRGVFNNAMSFDYDMDMRETDEGYEVHFDMTDLDQEKVDVQINKNSITVKGEQSRQETQKGPDNFINSQSFGSFMKTIPLPVDADTTKAQTIKEGDNLVIKLPKKKK